MRKPTAARVIQCIRTTCDMHGRSRLLFPIWLSQHVVTWPTPICAACGFEMWTVQDPPDAVEES